MSVLLAHRFLRAVRESPELAARIGALGGDATLEDIAAITAELGMAIAPADLRRAYRQDWMLGALAGNGSGKAKRASSSAASAI
ncbi:MAG TPA: Nif11-like leader peptide family natural product precursor [Sphingopyxis sp.]|nr:Nif11-like leader peptide family natural product precursor [Sphingopyxis sp.]HMP45662.1 Nif11-like leader peptide family natural product precursor [Sphingopyxis sp.]HMQ18738.1 Nif11-like leader peptide family natural product precursor [Sphingopyxis sp.]